MPRKRDRSEHRHAPTADERSHVSDECGHGSSIGDKIRSPEFERTLELGSANGEVPKTDSDFLLTAEHQAFLAKRAARRKSDTELLAAIEAETALCRLEDLRRRGNEGDTEQS